MAGIMLVVYVKKEIYHHISEESIDAKIVPTGPLGLVRLNVTLKIGIESYWTFFASDIQIHI